MLSSITRSAPASTASWTCSSRSHSTSTVRAGHRRRAARHRLGDREPGQVVVLHEHDVGQRAAVVDAARRLARPPSRGPAARGASCGCPRSRVAGLAAAAASTNRRVRDGHARQVAEEVERRPLGREHGRQRPPHLGHRRARDQPSPSVARPRHLDGGVDLAGRPRRRRPGRRGRPSARDRSARPRPSADGGTSAAVRSPSGPRSSAQGAAPRPRPRRPGGGSNGPVTAQVLAGATSSGRARPASPRSGTSGRRLHPLLAEDEDDRQRDEQRRQQGEWTGDPPPQIGARRRSGSPGRSGGSRALHAMARPLVWNRNSGSAKRFITGLARAHRGRGEALEQPRPQQHRHAHLEEEEPHDGQRGRRHVRHLLARHTDHRTRVDVAEDQSEQGEEARPSRAATGHAGASARRWGRRTRAGSTRPTPGPCSPSRRRRRRARTGPRRRRRPVRS